MTSSELTAATARSVSVSSDALTVELADGRRVSVPLAWYPRLAHGRPAERRRWQLIGDGSGIHWPELDEDIAVEALLLGKRSGESAESLRRWRAARQRPANKRLQPTARALRPGARRG
jgi:hypothetical protein